MNEPNPLGSRRCLRYDSFSSMWGGSTQLKLGRIGQRIEPDPFDPMHASNSSRPATRTLSPPDLNKPLPSPPPSPASRFSSTQPSSPTAEHSSVPGYALRSASTTASSITAPALGKKRNSIFPIVKRKKLKGRTRTVTLLTVDKGTQTEEWLLQDSRRVTSPRSSSLYFWSKKKRTPTSERSTATVKRTSSPSGRLSQELEATDYFRFPWFRPTESSFARPSPPEDSEHKGWFQILHKPTGSETGGGPDKSNDSIGTYESRYSGPPSLDQNIKNRTIRTSFLRSAASDSSIVTSSKLKVSSSRVSPPSPRTLPDIHAQESEGTSPDGTSPGTRRPNSSRTTNPYARLAPQGFIRYHKKSTTSGEASESHSPLRQEVRLLGQASGNPDPWSQSMGPDMFRVEIPIDIGRDSGPSPSDYAQVPDHLRSSPLCPMNPKHKSGGLGTCPLHGRRRTVTDTAMSGINEKVVPESLENVVAQSSTLSTLTTPTLKQASAKRTSLPNNLTEGERFKLKREEHSAGSPECPANQSERGICVYHGRNQPG